MKRIHSCSQCHPRVGVVIPARNEEKHIANTIDAVLKQSQSPVQIVVVNDCSTDNTREIAMSFENVVVVEFPYPHENWVITKELAKVFNLGLGKMLPDLQYVTIVGADEVLPYNHFEYITKRMMRDDITIASGRIMGEHNDIPRGSGRMVDWKWWQSVNGGVYPINYGYESWLIARCSADQKRFAVYPEIVSTVQRATATNYSDEKYYHRGQAYKALNYNRRFVLGRALVMILRQHKLRATMKMIHGFLGEVTPYEECVRKYYRDMQNRQVSIKNIPSLVRRFRSFGTD